MASRVLGAAVKALPEQWIEALYRISDPWAGNPTFHIGSIFPIVAMALLSEHRDLSHIHRLGQRSTQ